MNAAFGRAGEATLVIGTDCPVLTATHLRDAASVLREGADAVIVSAEDGGYVLIGLSQPVPELFTDMTWSSDGVMRSEEHTSELQSLRHLVCRLLLEKKKT